MRIPKLTIDMHQAVVAVAQNKNLAIAGKELGISDNAVFKRIQKASKILGTDLFEDNSAKLTEAGRRLYVESERVVQQSLLAEDKVAALLAIQARRLKLGHSPFLPPHILGKLLKIKASEGKFNIEHVSGMTRPISVKVAEGILQAGVGVLPIECPELVCRVLTQEALVVCLPPGHSLGSRQSINPTEVAGEDFIAVGREFNSRLHEEIEEFFSGFGVTLKIVADAFGPPEALAMVEQKIGLCLLPASLASRAPATGRPLTVQTLVRKYGVFFREDNEHPAVEGLVDLIMERFARHP